MTKRNQPQKKMSCVRVCRRCGTKQGFFSQRFANISQKHQVLVTSEICIDCECELHEWGQLDSFYAHLDKAKESDETMLASLALDETPPRRRVVRFSDTVTIIQ